MFLTVEAKLRSSINISTKFHNSPQGEKLASIKTSNRFLNRTKTVLERSSFYDWFSFSAERWWVNNSTSSSLRRLIELWPSRRRRRMGKFTLAVASCASRNRWSAFGYLLDMELIKHIMLIYRPWNCFDENRELEAPSRLVRNYSRNRYFSRWNLNANWLRKVRCGKADCRLCCWDGNDLSSQEQFNKPCSWNVFLGLCFV